MAGKVETSQRAAAPPLTHLSENDAGQAGASQLRCARLEEHDAEWRKG